MQCFIIFLASFSAIVLSKADPLQLTPSATFLGYNAFQTPNPPLTIHAHEDTNCDGGWNGVDVLYAQNWSVQFQSYHLSRDLGPDERIDILNALPQGGALNTAYWNNPVTCSYVVSSPQYPSQTKAGCHTLGSDVPGGAAGCIRVYQEFQPLSPTQK